MRRGTRIAALLAAAVSASMVAAAAKPAEDARAAVTAWPIRGKIVFRVTRGDSGLLVGRVTNEWHHDRRAYTIRSVTEPAGVVAFFSSAKTVQTSAGALTGSGLAPTEYRGERKGRTDTADFDRSTGRLKMSGGTPAEQPLPPDSQDLVSVFYQLGFLPGYGAGQDVPVTTGRKLEHYLFVRVGEDNLSLPFGLRRTLHLKAGPAPDGESTEVWVGLDGPALPLKIRYVDRKGDTYTQTAEAIDIGPAKN